MRRPDIHRTVAICMTLAGVASGFSATRVEAVPPEMTLPMVLGVSGLMLTVFGLVYTVHASIQAARFARLVRGEGVIARWTVNPHLWRDFREATGAKPRPRPDGVEVIVGEASSLVDGDFQSTPVRGGTLVEGVRWIEGTAPYLELTMKTSGKSGPVTWYHRIPLAAGGTDDGRRVYDHYAAALAGVDRRSIADRNLPLTRRIALIVAGACAAIAAACIAMVEPGTLRVELLVGIILGAIIAPVALVLALVAHLRLRRKERAAHADAA